MRTVSISLRMVVGGGVLHLYLVCSNVVLVMRHPHSNSMHTFFFFVIHNVTRYVGFHVLFLGFHHSIVGKEE
jgi:hypothetical protein